MNKRIYGLAAATAAAAFALGGCTENTTEKPATEGTGSATAAAATALTGVITVPEV